MRFKSSDTAVAWMFAEDRLWTEPRNMSTRKLEAWVRPILSKHHAIQRLTGCDAQELWLGMANELYELLGDNDEL